MKRLILILMMALFSAVMMRAQDWQYDEAHNLFFNCGLIARLKTDFGERNIIRFSDDDQMTLKAFLDQFMSGCADQGIGDAGGANDLGAAEAEGESAIVAVLEDGDEFTLADVGCSVRLADRFDANLNVSVAGTRREETAVDVYLPGESEKTELPNTDHEVVNVYGIETPIRNEWVERERFPLGPYRIDVHIREATYHFKWLREDEAVNTIIVNCLDLKADGEFEVDVSVELADGEFYHLEDSDCHVGTIDLEAEFFSTIVAGADRDNMFVEVTYPQMSTPVQMQYEESFISDEGIPTRIKWVEAPNFPTGAYLVSVTLGERTRHFRWNRRDDAFRTVVLTCLPAEG